MEDNQPKDSGIRKVLRLLRPILEEKEIIGKTIKMTELAQICRNHRRRLPNRSYRAKELAEELRGTFRGSSSFEFQDLYVDSFMEEDANGRRKEMIEFQFLVSKEQQYLNSIKPNPANPETPQPV